MLPLTLELFLAALQTFAKFHQNWDLKGTDTLWISLVSLTVPDKNPYLSRFRTNCQFCRTKAAITINHVCSSAFYYIRKCGISNY